MYIRLFGSLQIEDGQRWVGPDDLGGRKPKQLLEILLNERGRVVSKDRIVDLLWPDELPQNAAATLDTYVSVLRRHLEPTIVRARDSRYLRRVHPGYLFDASEVEIDVDRFQTLIVEGQHARDEGDLERTDHAFATAIGFYRGAYLEDEPQATWTLGPRERLARTYRDLLVATAGIAAARGKFDEGLHLCEQAIAHDPTCEEAYRQAMLCSYALGRQHEALHIFQRCSRALTQALGTGPMPETEKLYRRILQDTPVQQLLPQALPSLRTRQTEHIDVPFLGRQPELTFLEDAWRTSEQGVLLVTVQGEAGIGKSRLVTEFLHKSELRCGRAKCTELERDLPFSGLAAALANLLTPLNAQDAERAKAYSCCTFCS